MSIRNININKRLINIDPKEIFALLGGKDPGSDPHTHELIEELIKTCSKIMTPRGAYITKKAIPTGSKDEISIEGLVFNTGGTIRKMLWGAEAYAFFIATSGSGPEELSRSLISKGDYLEGYIADLVGSAIAESVAIQIHDQVRLKAGKNGLKATNRYSPGYCGWEVKEQQKLFSLFPEKCCGIVLSETSLMSPIKSLSGVIGTGVKVSFRDYTCEICSMKDCIFRRTRTSHPHYSPE
ncbi:MAG: vitamin B12 dependent-methionine synthase activation domain-containing protein [Bacteroidota bacterium]